MAEITGQATPSQLAHDSTAENKEAKADGIPDGSCAIKLLFLFNDAFIKYELEHSIREALSMAAKGCTMPIPCSSSIEREKYEDMIEKFKEAIKCWTPSMMENVWYNCEQLPPLLTNSTEMIRVQPTAEQRTGIILEPAARHLADIESQIPKPPSREIRFKYVLYASLQGLVLATSYLFTQTKVFAEYSNYFPDLSTRFLSHIPVMPPIFLDASSVL